jgi:DNA repair protein RadC
MNDTRRERLRQVIEPLTQLEEFSSEEAKQQCAESTPSYVTTTLKDLVRAGLLLPVGGSGADRFRWATAQQAAEALRWIDRQLHGDQVKQTPEPERPRERLIRLGAESLSNAELLAILIRVGVRNESAVTAGRRLANRFDQRMEELRRCSAAELRDISRAVTKASYSQIMAGIELGRRVAKAESDRPVEAVKITSTREAVEYCRRQFAYLAGDAVQEEFHIVTLDTKHKPIQTHRITVGTLDASLVHPREVFRPAIRDAASAVILVHNHPSGDPTPSREDGNVTDQLTEAGKLIGIQVLDHIVVAKHDAISIRESQ